MAEQIIPKASLWVGNHDTVSDAIITYLQRIYCKNNCTTCSVCKQIAIKQFHDIHWMSNSSNAYKIEDLSTIEQTMSYTRDDTTPYFFIITHSELLSLACANKLLKSLEDTAPGYYFILATNREACILPTMRSRCFIYQYPETSINNNHQESHTSFVAFFSKHQLDDIKTFHAILDQYKTGCESELLSLCNQLLEHLLTLHKKAELDQKKIVLHRITQIKTILTKGIPPGSAPLILRSLYLQWSKPMNKTYVENFR